MPMTPAELEQLLTDFTNAVRVDRTPTYEELRATGRYVDGLHGQRDVIKSLKKSILRLEGGGVFLFTGQIGSGKSTELTRLQAELRGPQVKAYYCDLADWLNLNEPISLGSFLVALLAAWVEQVGALQGQQTPAERLWAFLTKTEVLPKDFALEGDVGVLKAKVGFALQTDPNLRAHISEALRKHQSRFIQQVHEFVLELKSDLCAQGEKCVLIADSLEKLRGYGPHAETIYTSLQQLFVGEGAALKLPGVHVVYSVSPFLIEQNNQLPAQLGVGEVFTMPSVHVFQHNSHQPDTAGIGAMVALVKARFARCNEVFSDEQLQRMAADSGGDLRDFLRAIQVVLADDIETLPVPDEFVSYALGKICPPKTIPVEHQAWLARLDASHEPELSADISALTLQQYLASKHVLVYLNGSAWYAVHPLLRQWMQQRTATLPGA